MACKVCIFMKTKFFQRLDVTWWWRHDDITEVKGGTLTKSIFGCLYPLKSVEPSDRAWFEVEKNGIDCQNWVSRSRDFLHFSGKCSKFRHFEYDVIRFHLNIFQLGFLYLVVLDEYFSNMYRFAIIRLTVAEILAFENSKKVLTQQKLHIFLIFKC